MTGKVLHLIDHMGLGGAQRVICALLSLDGHSAHSLRKPDNLLNCQEDYTWTERKSMLNLKCVLDTYRKVRKQDINYIQCHMPIAKLVGLILRMLPWLNIKLIFHEHGTIFRRNFFYNSFIKVTDFLVYRHVTVSDKSKELLNKSGIKKDKIEIIRNFADIEKFSKSKVEDFELEAEGLKEGKFKVGFAGRIVNRKGWKTLIESVEYVKDVELIIVGTGNEAKKLKNKIQDRSDVYYFEYISDIRKLFNTVDCMVIPSHWDPNPLIFYESQAAEIPVIASNCNSLDEIAKDGKNSLLSKPRDPKDLAEGIKKIKENEDLKTSLKNNGKIFAGNNTKDNFQQEFKKYYSNLNSKIVW